MLFNIPELNEKLIQLDNEFCEKFVKAGACGKKIIAFKGALPPATYINYFKIYACLSGLTLVLFSVGMLMSHKNSKPISKHQAIILGSTAAAALSCITLGMLGLYCFSRNFRIWVTDCGDHTPDSLDTTIKDAYKEMNEMRNKAVALLEKAFSETSRENKDELLKIFIIQILEEKKFPILTLSGRFNTIATASEEAAFHLEPEICKGGTADRIPLLKRILAKIAKKATYFGAIMAASPLPQELALMVAELGQSPLYTPLTATPSLQSTPMLSPKRNVFFPGYIEQQSFDEKKKEIIMETKLERN